MKSSKKVARTAGLLYLTVVLTGIFSLVYVPSQITVRAMHRRRWATLWRHSCCFVLVSSLA